MITRIVSGGQSGADQGSLEAARELGIETGGWAPEGWMTEDGPQEAMLRTFGLKECPKPGYPARTEMNVIDSDGTVIFGYMKGGSYTTMCICEALKKPYLWIPTQLNFWLKKEENAELLCKFVSENNVQVLNIAGNRESKNKGIQELVRKFLVGALKA